MKLCNCGCGKVARSGGTLSAACYARQYRQTKKGLEAHAKANKRWRQKSQEKINKYRREYRQQTGFYVPPEVKELRRACQALEEALAKAERHKAVCGAS